jgi:hypothetical protein
MFCAKICPISLPIQLPIQTLATGPNKRGKHMAIKTSTFGRLELSGKEAEQFLKQVDENKPNPQASAALQRGRAILQQILPKKQLTK